MELKPGAEQHKKRCRERPTRDSIASERNESSAGRRNRTIRSVSTRGIKKFARNHLPPEHPLREVLMAERDTLTPEEFLAKMDVWLVLINRKD